VDVHSRGNQLASPPQGKTLHQLSISIIVPSAQIRAFLNQCLREILRIRALHFPVRLLHPGPTLASSAVSTEVLSSKLSLLAGSALGVSSLLPSATTARSLNKKNPSRLTGFWPSCLL